MICAFCDADTRGQRGPICDECLSVVVASALWPDRMTDDERLRLTRIRMRVQADPALRMDMIARVMA